MEEIFKSEGGFVNDPHDTGGATNMGITIGTLRKHRSSPVSVKDVRNLTKVEARAIYTKRYWRKVQGDALPSGIDAAVMDFAVNSGPARAIMFLQEIVGEVQDGVLGPNTLRKTRAMPNQRDLINHFCDSRMSFLRSLRSFRRYGTGWTRRVEGIRGLGLRLVNEPSPEAVEKVTLKSILTKLWRLVCGA